ncbi:hypothetical protein YASMINEVIRUS_566 [Yasminevirus sp. GU-2018]|uniref:Protein kinase domain-containing protein n=1 Tax=Yasminevirus sp. GU-2018 TaxID=2420051 RepID=A0A5K0U9L9_9VIRU|nr:hypothetical protein YASMINEVIRUS_566 [Yasminevirus sp. GU-2018]
MENSEFRCKKQERAEYIKKCREKRDEVEDCSLTLYEEPPKRKEMSLYTDYLASCQKAEKLDYFRTVLSVQGQQKPFYDNLRIYLVGLLLKISEDTSDLQSNDNYLRSLLHILLQEGLVRSSVSCEQLRDIPATGSQLGKNSASITVQYHSIVPDSLTNVLHLEPDKKKLGQLLDAYLSFHNFDRSKNRSLFPDEYDSNVTRLATEPLYSLLYRLVKIALDKLKKNMFVKIGPTTVVQSLQQIKMEREVSFYNMLTNLVFRNNTPHIATHIFSKECSDFSTIAQLAVDTEKGRKRMSDYFVDAFAGTKSDAFEKYVGQVKTDAFDGFVMMFTENMTPVVSLEKFISDQIDSLHKKIFDPSSSNADIDKWIEEHIRTMQEIMFQVLYTLFIFHNMKFVHNDLHLGNIMIETLTEPFDYYYVIGRPGSSNTHVIQLKSKYFVRIYDFDLSYIVHDGEFDNYVQNLKNLKINQFEVRRLVTEGDVDFELVVGRMDDLYKRRLSETYELESGREYEYSSKLTKLKKMTDDVFKSARVPVGDDVAIRTAFEQYDLQNPSVLTDTTYNLLKSSPDIYRKIIGSYDYIGVTLGRGGYGKIFQRIKDFITLAPDPKSPFTNKNITNKIVRWVEGAKTGIESNGNFAKFSNLKQIFVDAPRAVLPKIFFPQTIDLYDMQLNIEQNERWKSMDVWKKLMICAPLVDIKESGKIIDKLVAKMTAEVPQRSILGGSSQKTLSKQSSYKVLYVQTKNDYEQLEQMF